MMTPRAEFVAKIPKARVDELLDQGVGERFEPGPGRVMKEWLALDRHPERWTALAEEAYQFVKGEALRRSGAASDKSGLARRTPCVTIGKNPVLTRCGPSLARTALSRA